MAAGQEAVLKPAAGGCFAGRTSYESSPKHNAAVVRRSTHDKVKASCESLGSASTAASGGTDDWRLRTDYSDDPQPEFSGGERLGAPSARASWPLRDPGCGQHACCCIVSMWHASQDASLQVSCICALRLALWNTLVWADALLLVTWMVSGWCEDGCVALGVSRQRGTPQLPLPPPS
jgi:hypothetical protein